jgi:hypothetical protein
VRQQGLYTDRPIGYLARAPASRGPVWC